MAQRLDWIDQSRGLAILLVVYGHNYPGIEPYIYSFHVPLFFFIAGMFHPSTVDKDALIKRAKSVLVPYFCWALLLYLFWFFVGRKFGDSSTIALSPTDNFIGIFYAQGGQPFMDWGIPMWFLPCIFLVYIIYGLLCKIKNKTLFLMLFFALGSGGFIWKHLTNIHIPWSIDVACVAMLFYGIGNHLKKTLLNLNTIKSWLGVVFGIAIGFIAFYFNDSKIDMYRSIYGNPFLFLISGFSGTIGFMLLFKVLPVFKVLSYLGKNTIIILATHLRALTVIKAILLVVLGTAAMSFSETEKVLLTFAQIGVLLPVIWFINKYVPVLNGKIKKS